MTHMMRRDYIRIGQAIRDSITTDEGAQQGYITALHLADVFAADNTRFDKERFLRFVETGELFNGGDVKRWRKIRACMTGS